MSPRVRFRPKAVIFDMDGLMMDTERMSRLAWQRASRECEVVMDDAIYAQFIGLTWPDSLRLLEKHFGGAFPLERFQVLAAQYYSEQVDESVNICKPGLIELLDLLQILNCPCAVATSAESEGAIQLLRATGVASRIRVLVTSSDVSKGKPAPDVFLAAACKLQIDTWECLVLEDSTIGMEAAFAAGIPAIMVPDLVEPTPEIAARALCILGSLLDVCQFLRDSP